MNVLPLQFILVLRLALVSLMADGDDTEHAEVLRDVENATDDGVGRRAIAQSTSTHLHPAGAQSQLLSLILHAYGSDGAVLYPAVVLHRIAQHDDCQRSTLDELTTQILGI